MIREHDVDELEPATNGSADVTDPTHPEGLRVRVTGGQRAAKKTALVHLSGDFEGLWIRVWINAKRGRLRQMEASSTTVRDEIMAELVLEHNLTDDDGEPYPSPLTLRALDDMPLDQYTMVAQAIGEAIVAGSELPKA